MSETAPLRVPAIGARQTDAVDARGAPALTGFSDLGAGRAGSNRSVMRQRFEAVVQHATGRPAIGFMSGNQQNPDLICEVFVLSPTSLVEEADARAAGKA